jgi:hypothetical protein
VVRGKFVADSVKIINGCNAVDRTTISCEFAVFVNVEVTINSVLLTMLPINLISELTATLLPIEIIPKLCAKRNLVFVPVI